MKKLFVVALLAASVVGMAEARCGSGRCAPRREACAPVSCIRPACVVDCVSSTCEGEKPSVCALEAARVDVIKNVDTNIYYTCAPLKPCQVKPTQEQVDMLIGAGRLEAGTRACD